MCLIWLHVFFLFSIMNQNWVQKLILAWLWHHFHLALGQSHDFDPMKFCSMKNSSHEFLRPWNFAPWKTRPMNFLSHDFFVAVYFLRSEKKSGPAKIVSLREKLNKKSYLCVLGHSYIYYLLKITKVMVWNDILSLKNIIFKFWKSVSKQLLS